MHFEKVSLNDCITSDGVKSICNNQDIIFCPVGALDQAFAQIKHDCVLVCTETDGSILPHGMTKSHVNPAANVSFKLDHHMTSDDIIPTNIKAIYSASVNVMHDKVIPMPRGLENFNQLTHLKKPELLTAMMDSDIIRSKLLYINHHIDTNVSVRAEPYEIFETNDWCTVETGKNGSNFDTFINNIRSHKFVLSPSGNSLEAHRTWEALHIGTIPIVERFVFTEEFAEQLPLLIVDDWKVITEDFLNNKYEEFSNRTWNYDLLKLSYWKTKMLKSLGV